MQTTTLISTEWLTARIANAHLNPVNFNNPSQLAETTVIARRFRSWDVRIQRILYDNWCHLSNRPVDNELDYQNFRAFVDSR